MKVVMPIANEGFDPSEAAIPWKLLTDAGHEVVFATQDGEVGAGDPIMLTGEGLDPWGWIPVIRKIVVVGLFLRADSNSRSAYALMEKSEAFRHPMKYKDLKVEDFDGLLLPGGHAKGVRQYIEDEDLQSFVADFFDSKKPVGAVCHGVLVAARSKSKVTGKSPLYGHRTTALTWSLESSAWNLARITRFWDPTYYRTYLEEPGQPYGHMSVEEEVKRNLEDPYDFEDVRPLTRNSFRKGSGLFRDTSTDTRPSYVITSGHYVSARWPGDVHAFGTAFIAKLEQSKK